LIPYKDLLLHGAESERLLFRKLQTEDFETCLSFFKHPLSNRYWKSSITDPELLCREWFDRQMWRYENKMGGTNILIHKQTSALVGWCGLLVQQVDGKEELEVGYSIIPAYWNKGFATEAARKCIDYAFEKKLAPSIISIIQVDNIESIRVAEKNGLTIDKETVYHHNRVKIFRLSKSKL
jgi:RimJ/RimL family protein N-acetyltransferase